MESSVSPDADSRRHVLAIEGGEPVRPKSEFLIFGSPCIEEPEIDEVVETLRSCWIGTGPRAARFEEAFRTYKDAGYAAAVNSGTAALHLSCLAAGLGPGDEVITTPMTFCATASAIIHSGATPVFADCSRTTMNIDPEQVERRITHRTRAILPVHMGGRPCEMDDLRAIARERGLLLIEDCAHAIETEYHGRKAGTMGDFGAFSFYVTKNLITGEGGMILTSLKERIERVKVLALHGMSSDAWKRFSDSGYKHYEVVAPGFKYNMMDLQAAIGLHQLQRVEQYWQRRRSIWQRYNEAFADLPCLTPPDPSPNTRHAYHLYTLLLDIDRLTVGRDQALTALGAENIGVGVHYLALHTHRYYRDTFGYEPEDYPNAYWIGQRTISLPLSAKLADGDVADVIAAVRKVLRRYARPK